MAENASEPAIRHGPDTGLARLIGHAALDQRQLEYLNTRWLDSVRHMANRAGANRLLLYVFRGVSVVGSVLVPALIGVGLRLVATVVSVIVAATVGLTELMRFGPRWRLHRAYGTHLEQEGWRFLELSGPYSAFATHADAFDLFVESAERTIAEFEREYVRDVVVSGPTTPEPKQDDAPAS